MTGSRQRATSAPDASHGPARPPRRSPGRRRPRARAGRGRRGARRGARRTPAPTARSERGERVAGHCRSPRSRAHRRGGVGGSRQSGGSAGGPRLELADVGLRGDPVGTRGSLDGLDGEAARAGTRRAPRSRGSAGRRETPRPTAGSTIGEATVAWRTPTTTWSCSTACCDTGGDEGGRGHRAQRVVQHEGLTRVDDVGPGRAEVHRRHSGIAQRPGGARHQGLSVDERERQRPAVGLDDGAERRGASASRGVVRG